MGFLDNSGDIILDAVLTDTGRMRLAQGDGSFKIVKFALGDDEIDYSLYDKTNPNGSAYYDLNILQSPILEAFTNNMSTMNSKLLSIRNRNLLYLPVLKLNTKLYPTVDDADSGIKGLANIPAGGYIVTADYTTSATSTAVNGFSDACVLTNTVQSKASGIIRGANPFGERSPIVFDQGLDSDSLTAAKMAAGDVLMETQYLIEVDNRLCSIVTPEGDGNTLARPSYIDDDNIAGYYFTLNRYPSYFARPEGSNPTMAAYQVGPAQDQAPAADAETVIGNGTTTGVLGTRFGFNIQASEDLQSSNVLFSELGGTTATNYLNAGGSVSFRFIDTMLRVTGYYTGYRVDIPLRFIKKV